MIRDGMKARRTPVAVLSLPTKDRSGGCFEGYTDHELQSDDRRETLTSAGS